MSPAIKRLLYVARAAAHTGELDVHNPSEMLILITLLGGMKVQAPLALQEWIDESKEQENLDAEALEMMAQMENFLDSRSPKGAAK